MNELNEILQKEVQEQVPERYQAFAIQQLSPLLDKLTAENIAAWVKKIAALCGATENLVAAYESVIELKSEEQLNADTQANIEDMAGQVNANHAANIEARDWLTNCATGAALIALKLV
jgi:hypothetical protein